MISLKCGDEMFYLSVWVVFLYWCGFDECIGVFVMLVDESEWVELFIKMVDRECECVVIGWFIVVILMIFSVFIFLLELM